MARNSCHRPSWHVLVLRPLAGETWSGSGQTVNIFRMLPNAVDDTRLKKKGRTQSTPKPELLLQLIEI